MKMIWFSNLMKICSKLLIISMFYNVDFGILVSHVTLCWTKSKFMFWAVFGGDSQHSSMWRESGLLYTHVSLLDSADIPLIHPKYLLGSFTLNLLW